MRREVNAHKDFHRHRPWIVGFCWGQHGSRAWTRCSTRACRMDSEKELLDAFNRVVHEDFPNPRRIDCPGREVLLKLAQQSADAQLSHLLDHVRRCAPCFDELQGPKALSMKSAPHRA